ncbi:MAG: hypothetical protein AAFM91_05810 [Pseudomonadota bacterium]
MTTRREVMQFGLAVSGAAVAGPAFAVNDTVSSLPMADLVVVDTGIPGASAMARRYPTSAVREFSGDLLPVWRSDLRAALAGEDIRLVGVTAGQSAFCLSQFAQDYGYEITYGAPYRGQTDAEQVIERALELAPSDFHRPAATFWMMSKTGIAFR